MNSKSKISVSDAPMEPTGSSAAPMQPLGSSAPPMRPLGSSAVPMKPLGSSTAPMNPIGSSAAAMKFSGVTMKPIGQSGVSSDKGVSADSCSKKRNGKAIVCSDVPSAKADDVLFFKNATLGPQEAVLRFRLIHFWEALNTFSKTLIGLEMLLVDEEGTVIQGFIPRGRIDTYLRHMIPGCTYSLNNFFGSKTKTVYRVADPDVTISFSWNSVLSVLKDNLICFPEDRFRFHGYEAACDQKGDLYDYIGHIKLVNEQILNESLVLDEVEIASLRRILIHVQTHDGPVMRLYIWDKAATAFCEKFKSLGKPPTVILVTTVNPERFGGALSLSSVSASRVFFDMDVQPTREYLAWYESNTDVANRVNAEVVAKAETAAIEDLFSYMKQEGAKVAWFECKATIDDVIRDSAWYYIACSGCKTKATKRHTTLVCKKCGKTEIDGAPEYLAKITVYDNKEQASFVLLGDAGRELTGKPASELVENYFEANESMEGDHVVPVPQALIDTIGQTRTFVIKVSKHNLDGKTQSLTVTKVLPLGDPAPENVLDDKVVAPPASDALQMGNREEGASVVNEEPGDERVKRSSDMNVSDEIKRARRG